MMNNAHISTLALDAHCTHAHTHMMAPVTTPADRRAAHSFALVSHSWKKKHFSHNSLIRSGFFLDSKLKLEAKERPRRLNND